MLVYFSEFLAKEEYKHAYLSDEWSRSAMIGAIMKRHSVQESNNLTTLRKVHMHTQNTLSTCLLHKIDVVNQLADVDEHMLNGKRYFILLFVFYRFKAMTRIFALPTSHERLET